MLPFRTFLVGPAYYSPVLSVGVLRGHLHNDPF